MIISRRAYSNSKLANILHAKELGRRLSRDGVNTYSLHPGVISTEIFRSAKRNPVVGLSVFFLR